MEIRNSKSETQNKSEILNPKPKTFLFLILFSIFYFLFSIAATRAAVPVWIVGFDKCLDYQDSLHQFMTSLDTFLTSTKITQERRAQMRDIIKAREDVNKLVATVYNELRTQQIAYGVDLLGPDFRNVLQSVGIAVSDPGDTSKGELPEGSQEICKASYYIKAQVGTEPEQCVAVVQEARLITNQDDYIYEEGRRRSMDMLFCYLGDWRHFPITDINEQTNCEQLDLRSDCTVPEIWDKLGELLNSDGGSEDSFGDTVGTTTPKDWQDDQSVFNLCEGMRALGLKCGQDMLRDFIKYSTIDKITRKDRTVILAPPQTWYTPARCRVIDAFLPTNEEFFTPPKKSTPSGNPGTPYTKVIKSLDSLLNSTNVTNSFDLTNILFGSKFGNATIPKPPSNMDFVEYSIEKELQAINVPENGFSGLAAKAETLANQIIQETTDLRRLQYTSGEGLRDATLRIGWLDYEWVGEESAPEGVLAPFLGKYESLDLVPEGKTVDPIHPNKIFKPLPCYWGAQAGSTELSTANGCWNIYDAAASTGKTFYFDTGIVISPISITKSKLQSAIQAQFDLAQKAFDDRGTGTATTPPLECGASGKVTLGIEDYLPAPWEDAAVNLSSAINPLTGEPYTFGSPGEFNPPFRIPGISNNYFNFLYNDVFQLYHTSFPDVLAGWFRLETPAYDSIYGPLDQPIAFGPGGAPGTGPPGGLGIGGPPGIGSGIGDCGPVESGPCSVAELTANSCFGAKGQSEVFKASAVCNVESGGVPTSESGSDKCNGGTGPSFSIGLFQINLTVHDLPGLTACAEPPTEPGASAFNGRNYSCTIDNQGIYDQCVATAKNPSVNTQKACEILETQGWGAWSTTLGKCGFGVTGPVHSECQSNACIVVNGAGEIACTTDADCTGTQI